VAAANELHRDFPALLGRRRPAIIDLASELNIDVVSQPNLGTRALWQGRQANEDLRLWVEQREMRSEEIRIEPTLRETTRRFAIAHEIGHALLQRRSEAWARELLPSWQEAFANVFASELLISPVFREETEKLFREVSQPAALLRLADSIGLSGTALLRFATTRRNWLHGLDRLWVDVRYMPNRHTNRQPRMRVFRAYIDSERWYVAANQSVVRLFGTDDWLVRGGNPLRQLTVTMTLQRRGPHEGARYVRTSVTADVSALRMKRSRAARATEALVAADFVPADRF
jgi:IrrE N-terminal-like domain